jgi:cysteine desulfurase
MGMENPVYMDHNATTAVRPAVKDALARALDLIGNASSVHGAGRAARKHVEDSREQVAALVGARPAGVVFTSGGTEANNLAIRGAIRRANRRVLVSAVEHVSVLKSVAEPEIIAVDADGVIDLGALDAALAANDEAALVSVMLANNETGVIQPVAEVSSLAKKHGALVHCDAVQAAGKIAVDVKALGIDMLTLSAHKIGGPQGIGALVSADDQALQPIIRGGGQERSRRAGTENLPGIVGFGVAAVEALKDLPGAAGLNVWRDRIETDLAQHQGVRIFGAGVNRLANTTCLTMTGVEAEQQLIALDLAGIAVSAGSACSSGKVEPSHVLAAMGIEAEEAATAIRVSMGWSTTEQDVERFCAAWDDVRAKAQGKKRTAA